MVLRLPIPGPVEHFDMQVDAWFEPLRKVRFANRVAFVASEGAHYSMLWHAAGIAMAIARPDLRSKALRMAITLGVESIIVNGILKPTIRRERPGNWEVDLHQVRRPKTASFPSGHASSGAVAATLLSDAMPGGRSLWWTAAGIVAASRVHTRMHHASDVVAGAMVGRVIGLVARRPTASVFGSSNVGQW